MKKMTILFVFVVALALLVACGGEKAATDTAGDGAEAVAQKAPVADAVDNELFTMTPAEGWLAGPVTHGMVNVLPGDGRTSPGLYFKFEGHGNAAGTAEASIQSMIKNYNGSPMEETQIAGVPFKTTTYTFGKSVQTMHVAFRKGTKITITIEGEGAKDNPDIRAMLDSLELK